MRTLINALYRDEAGFLISAELVLIGTIAVLSLVVGLSEISFGVNNELEDVGSALGSVQQSFVYRGLSSHHKGAVVGSYFRDHADFCDSEFDLVGTDPVGEHGGHGHHGGGYRHRENY